MLWLSLDHYHFDFLMNLKETLTSRHYQIRFYSNCISMDVCIYFLHVRFYPTSAVKQENFESTIFAF